MREQSEVASSTGKCFDLLCFKDPGESRLFNHFSVLIVYFYTIQYNTLFKISFIDYTNVFSLFENKIYIALCVIYVFIVRFRFMFFYFISVLFVY